MAPPTRHRDQSFATVAPVSWDERWIVAAKVASGLATAWIAIDRALQFGPRWQFGMRQRSAFRSIQIELGLVEVLPAKGDQEKQLHVIADKLFKLYEDDAKVPELELARIHNKLLRNPGANPEFKLVHYRSCNGRGQIEPEPR